MDRPNGLVLLELFFFFTGASVHRNFTPCLQVLLEHLFTQFQSLPWANLKPFLNISYVANH